MHLLKQGTAATTIVGPVMDSTGGPVTAGPTIADLRITKNGTVSIMSAATTLTHDHNGHWLVGLQATDAGTVGQLVITMANVAWAMPEMRYEVLASQVFDVLTGTVAPSTVTQASVDSISTFTPTTAVVQTVWAGGGSNTKYALHLRGNPIGGRFSVAIDGNGTDSIEYDANAAYVQQAICEVVGVGNAEVTGGPGPHIPWYIEFVGSLAGQSVTLTAAGSDLDGADLSRAVGDLQESTAVQGAYVERLAIDANGNVSAVLGTAYDVYHADIAVTVDSKSRQDEYTVVWFKNGVRIAEGTTNPTLQVVKRSDGTDLIAPTTMSQIGTTGNYKYDEATNRLTPGEAAVAVVTIMIDNVVYTYSRVVSRDK